jgi:phage-related protein
VMVCVHEGELVALHAFIKKTQKTPAGDMTLARSRKRRMERAK